MVDDKELAILPLRPGKRELRSAHEYVVCKETESWHVVATGRGDIDRRYDALFCYLVKIGKQNTTTSQYESTA